MWQAGVREIVYALNGSRPKMIDNDEYKRLSKEFIEMSGIKIKGVTADLTHLSSLEKI